MTPDPVFSLLLSYTIYYSSPSNALPREDSSVAPDMGGFDVANAVTLGALGVGAVGSLVYALYADRAMKR